MTVTAVDQYGDAYPAYAGGHCLTFGGPSTSPSPASAAPGYPSAGGCTGASAVVFTAGVATPTVTLYAAEATALVVTDPTSSRSGSTNLTVAAGPANDFAVSASNPAPTAGTSIGISLAAHDAYDNVVTTYAGSKTIAWSGLPTSPFPANRAPTYPAAAVSFSGGLNTTPLTATAYAASLNSLIATDSGGLTGSLPLAVSAATASQLLFPAMTARSAGNGFALTLTAADAYANPAAYSGVKTLAWSGASAAPSGTAPTLPTSATFSNGAATVNLTLVRAETLALSVGDGTLNGTSASFTVDPGAASKLAFTVQPTNAVSTAALSPSPVVAVQDSFGNVVTGDTSQVRVAIGANPAVGTLAGTTAVSAAGGLATFSGLSIDKAGTGYTLVATDGLLTTVSSTAFNIAVGPAVGLVFSVQTTGAAGTGVPFPTQPQVTVQDAGGNTVTTYSTGITLSVLANPGGATLACTTNPLVPTSGVASFAGCRLSALGVGYTLNATSGAMSKASAAFNVTTAATKLVFTTSPNGGTAGVAWTQQPVVAVEDASSRIVTADSGAVSLAITTGTGGAGAALSCPNPTVSASLGTASFSGCSIAKAASGYSLTATHAGPITGISASFNIVAGVAANAQFTQSPGNGTLANATLNPQPTVTLVDAYGNVPTGANPVTLSITSVSGPGGAALSCTSNPVTPVNGVATFAGCAISQWGNYTMTATSGAVSVTSAAFDVYLKAPLLTVTNNGGNAGARKPEQGDVIAITYPDPIPTSTFCGGWSGAAPLGAVTVGFTSTGGDQITAIRDATECTGSSGFGAPGAGLGGIALGTTNQYFTGAGSFSGSSAAWNAGTNTLTITLGTQTGTTNKAAGATSNTATYTPSASLGLPASVVSIVTAGAGAWF